MIFKPTHLIIGVCITLLTSISYAACSDNEYRLYKEYDAALEAYPSIPDSEIRDVYAKKFRMKPSALKDLYFRCTHRWTEQSPEESNAHLKKSLNEFSKDCSKRPVNDPYCKTNLGK